jgi:purine-cytosine permease-like protein
VLARNSRTPALILILVLIVADTLTINVPNLYTGGLSVADMVTSLGRSPTAPCSSGP